VTVKEDPGQVQEWLRQNNLNYGGLIGIGVLMVQPFLTAASLDLSAKISIVAFSVAIPLLAALVLVNRQEAFRRRATSTFLVEVARVVGQVGEEPGDPSLSPFREDLFFHSLRGNTSALCQASPCSPAP
jgi:hypothetical protein